MCFFHFFFINFIIPSSSHFLLQNLSLSRFRIPLPFFFSFTISLYLFLFSYSYLTCFLFLFNLLLLLLPDVSFSVPFFSSPLIPLSPSLHLFLILPYPPQSSNPVFLFILTLFTPLFSPVLLFLLLLPHFLIFLFSPILFSLFTLSYSLLFSYPTFYAFLALSCREGWVDYLELSKRTDFNPSTTTFFWFLDKNNLEKNILEHSYQAVFNLRSRYVHGIKVLGLN